MRSLFLATVLLWGWLFLLHNKAEKPGSDFMGKGEVAAPVPHLDLAYSYLGVSETTNNHGPEVRRFLNHVGLDEGFPWCAAFTSYILSRSGAEMPTVRSARSRDFVTNDSIPVRLFVRTGQQPVAGSIAVFRRGDGPFGHTDFIVDSDIDQGTLRLIGGNVRPPSGEGLNGVWERNHTLNPFSYFRITDITPVKYGS